MEVQSIQQGNYQPSKKNTITSGIIGATVAVAPSAYVFYDAVSKPVESKLKQMGESMKILMPEVDTLENIKKYASNALKDTGLADKGVKIKYVNSSNVNEVTQEITQFTKKQPFGVRIAQKFGKMFEYGGNAAFVNKNNTAYIGEKGAYSSVFHELGHALNHNSSKLMKFMQQARTLTPYNVPVVGLGLFAASLFHTVKPESKDHPKSGWEKTKDFVKNNAGKITFATFLPTLIEEAAASVKGIKMAKKYLKPEQLKQLAKNYTGAYSTYAIAAVALSAAVGLGNMIANRVQKSEKQV